MWAGRGDPWPLRPRVGGVVGSRAAPLGRPPRQYHHRSAPRGTGCPPCQGGQSDRPLSGGEAGAMGERKGGTPRLPLAFRGWGGKPDRPPRPRPCHPACAAPPGASRRAGWRRGRASGTFGAWPTSSTSRSPSPTSRRSSPSSASSRPTTAPSTSPARSRRSRRAVDTLRQSIYRGLTRWQRVQIARQPRAALHARLRRPRSRPGSSSSTATACSPTTAPIVAGLATFKGLGVRERRPDRRRPRPPEGPRTRSSGRSAGSGCRTPRATGRRSA